MLGKKMCPIIDGKFLAAFSKPLPTFYVSREGVEEKG